MKFTYFSFFQVWFRKGIKPDQNLEDESAVVGTSWIEMVGEMGMISVGHHDQVMLFCHCIFALICLDMF